MGRISHFCEKGHDNHRISEEVSGGRDIKKKERGYEKKVQLSERTLGEIKGLVN